MLLRALPRSRLHRGCRVLVCVCPGARRPALNGRISRRGQDARPTGLRSPRYSKDWTPSTMSSLGRRFDDPQGDCFRNRNTRTPPLPVNQSAISATSSMVPKKFGIGSAHSRVALICLRESGVQRALLPRIHHTVLRVSPGGCRKS